MDSRLNTNGGARTFRHVGVAERRMLADTDIARRVRSNVDLDVAPEKGDAACFFREELDRWHQLDLTVQFRRFNNRVAPLSTSLAQLLHHRESIVDELCNVLRAPEDTSWKTYLALAAVLARDLREELLPRYNDIAVSMRALVDPLLPERTAEVFRTLSLMFKHLGTSLFADRDYSRHFNDWAVFLRHRKLFLRDLAAGSLAFLLRRHTLSGQRTQIAAVLRSIGQGTGAGTGIEQLVAEARSVENVRASIDEACLSLSRSRGIDLRDGVGRLVFESFRGPLSGFHSRAPTLMEAILGSIQCRLSKVEEAIVQATGPDANIRVGGGGRASAGKKRQRASSVEHEESIGTGAVADARASATLLPGAKHDLLLRERVEGLTRVLQVRYALRAEVVAHAFRLTATHVHGGADGSGGGEQSAELPWTALLDALEAGVITWQECDSELSRELEYGGGEVSERQGPSSKKKAGSAGAIQADCDPHLVSPSIRAAALEAHLASISLYLAQICAMLTTWCSFKNGVNIPRNSDAGTGRLGLFLRRLTGSGGVWHSPHSAGIFRLCLLKLIVAAWVPVVCGNEPHASRPGKKAKGKGHAPWIRGSKAGGREGSSKGRGAGRILAADSDDSDNDDDDNDEQAEVGDDKAEVDDEDDEDDTAFNVESRAAEAAERAKLGERILSSVFSLPPLHPHAQPGAVDKIAEAITAGMAGVLLPSYTPEGPQFPDVSRAGRSPSFKPSHVGSLDAQALVLSFAREMLALSVRIQANEAEENGEGEVEVEGGKAESVLAGLLPHLLGYLSPLFPAIPAIPATLTIDSVLRVHTEEQVLVVCSSLLCARDAVLPRGSGRRLPLLRKGIGKHLSATGRLGLGPGSTVSGNLIARLHAMPHAVHLIFGMSGVAEDGGDGQRRACEGLMGMYAAVAATAAIDLPAAATVAALLDLFRSCCAAVEGLHEHGVNGDSTMTTAAIPAVSATALHLASASVLNASRLLHDACTMSTHTDADADTDMSAAHGSGTKDAPAVQGLLLTAAAPMLRFVLSVSHMARSVHAAQARLAVPDTDVTQRADAVLLAALNSAAAYFEEIAGVAVDGGAGVVVSVETGRTMIHALQRLAGGQEHSLRLSALRLIAAFPCEDLLAPGAAVPTLAHVHASGDGGTASVAVPFLFDDRLHAEADSRLEGSSPVPDLLLRLEALPNSASQERYKAVLMSRVGVMLATRRLPPAHVSLALHTCLGVLHAKFAPMWAAATKVLSIAAEHYPRTTWAVVGRALHAACIARAPAQESSSTSPSVHVKGESRSESRAAVAGYALVPLRVTALAVAALTGRDPDAMSMAGTVVSLAESSANAGGSGDGSSGEAAIPPGRAELANRMATCLTHGLFGADAGMPALVARLVADAVAGTAADVPGAAILLHANDAAPLSLGAGGCTDAETLHRTLLGVLRAAPQGWAEARSSSIVPLFLAFMRDDWYGPAGTHGDDPDGAELDLAGAVQSLAARHRAGAEVRISREAAKVAKARQGQGLSRSDGESAGSVGGGGADSGFASFEADTDSLLASLVQGGALSTACARSPLPPRAASVRAVSFLSTFAEWSGWDGVAGRAEVAAVASRLLLRLDADVGETALKVLLAMRLPGLTPYRDRLLRLAGDRTYREEMVHTPLAPSAGVIAPEHRPVVVPVVLRLMYGRLLQRKGHSARDSPAARRAAVLAYVAGALAGSEVAFFVYQAVRPFLMAGCMVVPRAPPSSGQGSGKDAVLEAIGCGPGAGLADIPAIATAGQAAALLAAVRSSFAPVDGARGPALAHTHAQGAPARDLRYVTAPRAIGALNMLKDIIRQLGSKVEPHLHVLLAIILGCLSETRVRAGQSGIDVDEVDAEEDGGEGEGEGEGSDRGLDEGEAEDVEGVEEGEEEGEAEAMHEDGPTLTAATHDEPTTALVRRAREIRSLSLLRLANVISKFGSASVPPLLPWLPTLQACLEHATAILPYTMASASKPSGLLNLFSVLAADTSTLPLLHSPALSGSIPAVLACLTTGLPGAKEVYDAHVAHAPSHARLLPVHGSVDGSGSGARGSSAGPSQPVAAAAFAFLDALLTGMEGSQGAHATHSLAPHFPFVLRHLCTRMRANLKAPQAFDAALSALSAGQGGGAGGEGDVVVPSLRGGVKAFARQQLVVLGRLADLVTRGGSLSTDRPQDGMEGGLGATLAQLVLLLLPYLRGMRRSGDNGGETRVSTGRTGMVKSTGPDIPLLSLIIISRLAPHLPTPAPFLPFFTALLAPGPRELSGPARTSLLALLRALTLHPTLAHLRGHMDTLASLGAMHARRVGEADYDAILGGLEGLSSGASHASLLGPAAAALPALLHQTLHLMRDSDMSTRTAALNAATAFVKSAGEAAMEHWTTVEAPALSSAYQSGAAVPPAEPAHARVLPGLHASTGTPPSQRAHDVGLYAIVRVLVPGLRSSMGTSSPGLRRSFMILLSDVVNGWMRYGVVHVECGEGGEGGMADDGGAPRGLAVRAVSHPNLHSDLGVLSNSLDPEADGWLNLTHVQIHRRARALARLATLVSSGGVGLHSLREFVLPVTLHSLFDEAGSVGGFDVLTVESKGRRVRVGAAADKAGAASGLHAEAVKLIGSTSRVLPWPLYLSTMRTLMRLAGRAGAGVGVSKKVMAGSAAASALEKALLRAVAAMAEGFHFNTALPPADGSDTAPGPAGMEMGELELEDALISAVGHGRKGGMPLSRSALLATSKAKEEEEEEVAGGDGDGEGNEGKDGVDEGEGEGHDDPATATEPAAHDDASTVISAAGSDSDLLLCDAGERSQEQRDGAEITRRDILLGVASHLLPALRRLLRRAEDLRPGDSASKRGKPPGPADAELRPSVAFAIVALCRALPPRVAAVQNHKLLLDLITSLRSRRFEVRETARVTIGKVAVILGPPSLGSVVTELKRQMREGYMAHVRGHALHALLEALAPCMTPPPPPVVPAPGMDEGEGAQSAVPHPIQSTGCAFLVSSLPDIMSMLMDDACGETAASRGAGVVGLKGGAADDGGAGVGGAGAGGAGYRPSKDLALREAKSSRAGDTLELVSRCIPFLPASAIHGLTAPLLVALEDDKGTAGLATALGRPGVTSEIIEGLFKRILAGLGANPSVSGPYVLLYAHGVCTEFLGLSAQSAHVRILADEAKEAERRGDEEAAASLAGHAGRHAAGLSAHATPAPGLVLPAFADAYRKYMRLLSRPKNVGMAGVNNWMVKDRDAALGKAAGAGTGRGGLSGAMRQRGAGVSSSHPDVWTIAAEPKMTGTGRRDFNASGKRGANNSASASAGDVPMSAFALSLVHASLTRGRISGSVPLHVDMLDPYVPLLLRVVEDGGHAKLTTLALRLLGALLPYPLPMLKRVSGRLSRAVLTAVERSSGGSAAQRGVLSSRSELAQAALKACAVLVRACDWARVSEEQLRALLALLRGDLPIVTRQNATFGMLRAIVNRRLVVAEVYDLMGDVAQLLVTSLRPTARAAAAGLFLSFLMRYPLADKALAGHLDFFIRNLGYSQEPGRATVLDVLAACVSRFPQPVLDEHAAVLLLPLTVRLVAEPSASLKAAVGAIIRHLFKAVSAKTAVALTGLCTAWLVPGGKAGVRRSACQVVALATSARGADLFPPSPSPSSSSLLHTLLTGLTREITSAITDVAIIEERLSKQQESDAAAAAVVAAVLLDAQGDEAEEGEERLHARAATAHVQAALSLSSTDEKEEDEDEDESPGGTGLEFPVGTAGGTGPPPPPTLAAHAQGTGLQPRASTGVSVPLVWEPAYHALCAAEALMRCVPEGVEDVVGWEGTGCGGLYEGAPHGWVPGVVPAHSRANVFAAACNALTYPHTWVRLAASRVLGTFMGRRSVDLPGSSSDWLRAPAVLTRLCFRTVATLDCPGGPGPALSEQATRNLVAGTLALRAVLGAGVGYRAPLDEAVAAGHAADMVALTGSAGGGDGGGDDAMDGGGQGDGGAASRHRAEAEEGVDEESGAASGRDADALLSVFFRVTSTASRSAHDGTKAAALRWAAAVSLRLPQMDLLRCLTPVVRLVHRLTALALPERECSGDTRALAGEAIDIMQGAAGAHAFGRAMAAERARIASRRIARRREGALQRVLDPVGAARAKDKRQAAKLRYKKRKVAAFKAAKGKEFMGRGRMGGGGEEEA